MTHDHYPDSYIRGILNTVKTVAMVGASPNEVRPSYFVLRYLVDKGFDVYPINPGHAGKEIYGRKVYARMADVPVAIDMVDAFRAPEHMPGVLEEALALSPLPKVLWMQLGVWHDEVAAKAEAAGMKVVMNRCPKIEYGRLSTEIGWMGVNSRVITAKKPQRQEGGVQKMKIGD